ncbi:restriction endonuclease subunit R [Weissella confusa]|nr:restriction endonuclease subunit R [Weissella confusa]
MAEDKFEQAVAAKLKGEGWVCPTDYSGVTVDRLYNHWLDILNVNMVNLKVC